MRAFLLKKHGPAAVLRLTELPAPEPAAGEVRVRVRTIGINYAEVLSRKGLYGWAPSLPYIPGMEAFGVIEAVGAGVPRGRIGEPVIVGTQCGSYAEKMCVPAAATLPAIAGFSPEENAAFAVNYMTAWVSLMEMARLRRGDCVLISPAAGGVGTAALQLAVNLGCRVYGLAGSEAKCELVRRLGAAAAINYREDSTLRTLRARPEFPGIDVAIEMVGGETYRRVLEILNPFGRVVVAGFASLNLQKWNPISWWRTWRDLPRADIRKLAERGHGVLSLHLGYLLQDTPRLLACWTELTAFVSAHEIRPVIGEVFDFTELPAAHAAMESRRSMGKLIVRAESHAV